MYRNFSSRYDFADNYPGHWPWFHAAFSCANGMKPLRAAGERLVEKVDCHCYSSGISTPQTGHEQRFGE
jgi:hypothetical protein